MFRIKPNGIDEKPKTFEENLEELADLLKEIHDKIISGELNSREDLIMAYEEKINEMAGRFSDINHQRVKPYFDRYDLILTNFEKYKENQGNI